MLGWDRPDLIKKENRRNNKKTSITGQEDDGREIKEEIGSQHSLSEGVMFDEQGCQRQQEESAVKEATDVTTVLTRRLKEVIESI